MPLFGPYHLFWLGLTGLFVVFCIRMRRVPPEARAHTWLRWILFGVLLFNETSWTLYRHLAAGVPLHKNLPLHLCDLSALVVLLGLATDRKFFAALAYYMGVVGALLAVCLPAISETGAIRPVAEIRYFSTHIILVGSGFYLTYGRRFHPGLGAALRSYLFIHLYALLVTPFNMWCGTNYFYTLGAPKKLAWIHQYPHWAFLLVASLVFLALFGLMSLPFRRTR